MSIWPSFSNVEPLSMRMFAAPVHVVGVVERLRMVRPLSRSLQQLAPLRPRVAPLATVVVPLSLIAPPDQLSAPPTVTSPVPPSVPPETLTVVGETFWLNWITPLETLSVVVDSDALLRIPRS